MLIDKTTIIKIPDWIDLLRDDGGIILIDKEKEWTSFDVIAKLRGILKIKKIGHAGTLDPLATGLLIVCVGKYTKIIDQFQSLIKEYTGTIKFGATTKTEDAESEEENIQDVNHLKTTDINLASYNFIGKYLQMPPKYSAKKVNGQRAYQLARNNVDFELKPKQVEIFSFNIRNIQLPFCDFKVSCSKGTYIRSLARDLGESLQCGAYLSSLRRNAIGSFTDANALKINDVINITDKLR